MRSRFDIQNILKNLVGCKGLPYPGLWFRKKRDGELAGDDFEYTQENEIEEYTKKGSLLRKKDLNGIWVFMPVVFVYRGKSYELPNAVVQVVGKKTIVETAMVGRRGSVKELISVDDYQITIAGVLVGNGLYPEDAISEMDELYNINEPVTLQCAFTDLLLESDDKVVIKSIDYPSMPGYEDIQAVKLSVVSDKSFELIID